MRWVGITGHVDVPDEVAHWLATALTTRLKDLVEARWRGITCLAKGSDQLFADVLLRLKGSYDVVLPAADYAEQMTQDGDAEPFGSLLAEANEIRTMPYQTSSRAAYLAASLDMLERCDLLLAAWNGSPSRNIGDTADVVQKARERGIPVFVIWPSAENSAKPVLIPAEPQKLS
jgi:hypothetical protein